MYSNTTTLLFLRINFKLHLCFLMNVLFEILRMDSANIFVNVSPADTRLCYENMVENILATDISRHFDMSQQVRNKIEKSGSKYPREAGLRIPPGSSVTNTPNTGSTHYLESEKREIKNIVSSSFIGTTGSFEKITYIQRLESTTNIKTLLLSQTLQIPSEKEKKTTSPSN